MDLLFLCSTFCTLSSAVILSQKLRLPFVRFCGGFTIGDSVSIGDNCINLGDDAPGLLDVGELG